MKNFWLEQQPFTSDEFKHNRRSAFHSTDASCHEYQAPQYRCHIAMDELDKLSLPVKDSSPAGYWGRKTARMARLSRTPRETIQGRIFNRTIF